MNDRMRDYMMRDRMTNRDERNPYGSKGGYVSSDRMPERIYDRDYDERDYRMGHNYRGMHDGRDDGAHHMNVHYDGAGYYEGEFRGMTDNRSRRDYRDYAHHEYDRRMYPDFGTGYLSKYELHDWQHELCKSMGQEECAMFEYEAIIHEAESMGMIFDRFSKEEFYTTVLMMYSDYCKSCGHDPSMYIKMAKDFLEDHDARYKFGEKLAAYYDTFVK